MTPGKCELCGKALNKGKRFCSNTCKHKAHRVNPLISGVYLMIGWSNGAHYIGSARDVYMRWTSHRTSLRCKRHTHQKSFETPFKDKSLTFFLLQELPRTITKEQMLEHEFDWAKHFPNRVNIWKNRDGGYKLPNRKKPVLTKALRKIYREAGRKNKGRKFGPEFRQQASANTKALWKDPDYSAKRMAYMPLHSKRMKGKNNPFFGKTHTPETREKIRQSNMRRWAKTNHSPTP